MKDGLSKIRNCSDNSIFIIYQSKELKLKFFIINDLNIQNNIRFANSRNSYENTNSYIPVNIKTFEFYGATLTTLWRLSTQSSLRSG
jgi:hypothetical protein